MKTNIKVSIENSVVGELFYNKEENSYGFNYTKDKPISLIMPYKKSTYLWKNRLHPIFQMNIPEGYLYEVFKNFLSKEYGYINDFLVLSYLSSNIEGRLKYKSNIKKSEYISFNIDDVLNNDTEDTFNKILQTFLSKNAISGIQPKTLALINDKSTLNSKEYIIKTWGENFPNLSENEYFCLKAVEDCGVKIPNIKLSTNKNFLLVERFNIDNESSKYLGFEEVLGLLGKNSDEKYNGSYEQVAKVIYTLSTDKVDDMESLFKTVTMNFMLGNGDAHLKNFGVLYSNDFEWIKFAPSYDIVNTTSYIFKDRPALSLNGNKTWPNKKNIINFGVKNCYISKSKAERYYKQCLLSAQKCIEKIKSYIIENPNFRTIGNRIIDTIGIFTKDEQYKELPGEVIRNWK